MAVPWDIAYFIKSLKPKLGEHAAEFFTSPVAALNGLATVIDLDLFPEWNSQPVVIPLDTPWQQGRSIARGWVASRSNPSRPLSASRRHVQSPRTN